MWVPGYGTEDFKQSKKLGSTEAHKQVKNSHNGGLLLPGFS